MSITLLCVYSVQDTVVRPRGVRDECHIVPDFKKFVVQWQG